MADPSPSPPMNYPNSPPPPQGTPGAYPAPGYPGWQGAPPTPYRGSMLPPWLSFGGILVLLGGILVLVGFIVEAIASAIVAGSTAANSFQSFYNTMALSDALIGVGIFLAFLGWLFHQMSRHRQMGH